MSDNPAIESQITPIKIAYSGPKLIVTVDTEEAFNWSAPMTTSHHSVNSPEDIAPFQKICADAGVNPLYFISWPILKNPAMREYFKSLRDANAADTGLHLHQWVTPPLTSNLDIAASFQTNLPDDLHLQKLHALAAVSYTHLTLPTKA